jgi:prepilin-type N-terminal cleavage/methylation domain-containing protein
MTGRLSQARRGFTLVELLVVIAIIGVLVALLLPAVQAAREAARRAQCTTNLKNLALAVLNFEDANKYLPAPATVGDFRFEPMLPRRAYGSWAIDILPFIEQAALHNSIDLKKPTGMSDPVNAAARATPLEIMRCPTDTNSQPFNSPEADEGDNWARGNYGLNGFQYWPGTGFNRQAAGFEDGALLTMIDFNVGMGIVVQDPAIAFTTPPATGLSPRWTMKRITDGTTNTIMLGELRTGLSQHDRRGVWAMGFCGSNYLCRHAWNGQGRPNTCSPGYDDIASIGAAISDVGAAVMEQECMQADPNVARSGQVSVRSLHPGGAFVALADASVRFISDFVDTGELIYEGYVGETGPPNGDVTFRVWQRLNVGADGMTFELPGS